MKLEYNVLWFDDRPKNVASAQEHIKLKLARMGFDLKLDCRQDVGSEEAIKNIFRKKDYDLLVVDYKLKEEDRDGSDLIKIIRRYCTATDIVFYSSETPAKLRSKISVDGVYCYNRNDLPANLTYIIESRLRKVLDLNQMRGLYLAAVADFDHLIDDLFHRLVNKVDKEKYIDEILNTTSSFYKKSLEKIEKLGGDKEIDKYTSLLSSQPKIQVLVKILNEIDDERLYPYINSLANYPDAILVPRNQLAHAMEKSCTQGKYVLKNSDKETEFNFDDFLNLRHKILDYRDTFERIDMYTK
ncbi:response regulator [Photobacterium leiognathi]|uniref:hypothetical protein n=1 Tax=Photobacterium leiognathi TaxID=553611 RepID=UPI002980F8C3|nr:hypothetical protein [Photobacterium leiognathi]